MKKLFIHTISIVSIVLLGSCTIGADSIEDLDVSVSKKKDKDLEKSKEPVDDLKNDDWEDDSDDDEKNKSSISSKMTNILSIATGRKK